MSRSWSLQADLEDLERTNPAVGAAARRYDEMVQLVLGSESLEDRWARINARRQMQGKPPIGPFERRKRHETTP